MYRINRKITVSSNKKYTLHKKYYNIRKKASQSITCITVAYPMHENCSFVRFLQGVANIFS